MARALYASPEIQSLQGGILKADFGLVGDPSGPIVTAVALQCLRGDCSSVLFWPTVLKEGLRSKYNLRILRTYLVLGVGVQPVSGGALPWLEWLLKLGDAVVVAEFGVEYGPFGRTGMAHMS